MEGGRQGACVAREGGLEGRVSRGHHDEAMGEEHQKLEEEEEEMGA